MVHPLPWCLIYTYIGGVAAAASFAAWVQHIEDGAHEKGKGPDQHGHHKAADEKGKQAPLDTYSAIYQPPPSDYDTRIPMLWTRSPAPAAARSTQHSTQLQLRTLSCPPLLRCPISAAVSLRPAAGLPALLHPAALTSGSGASQLPFKLLAAAAALLLGAVAYPATYSTTVGHWQRQHHPLQDAQQHYVQRGSASAATQDVPGSTATQLGPQHAAAALGVVSQLQQQQEEFGSWMQQNLPAVLQEKRAELQQLQDMQGDLHKLLQEGRSSTHAGHSVLGLLQALQQEEQSVQVQVEALEAQLG